MADEEARFGHVMVPEKANMYLETLLGAIQWAQPKRLEPKAKLRSCLSEAPKGVSQVCL